MGEIRIVGPGKTRGYPYLVCKKKVSYMSGVVGWCDGAGKLPVPGRPTNLDLSRARAYCACSWCGLCCFDIFLSSVISLFFLPLFGRRPDID